LEVNLDLINKLNLEGIAAVREVDNFRAVADAKIAAGKAASGALPLVQKGPLSTDQKALMDIVIEGQNAEKRLTELKNKAKNIGSRLQGAQKFLDKHAQKLLGKIDIFTREGWDRSQSLGGAVRSAKGNVDDTVGKIKGQVGKLGTETWPRIEAPELPKAKALPPGKGGGGGTSGKKSEPSKRWERGGGGTGTSSIRRDMQEGLGPEKSLLDAEIENFEQGISDILTGLAKGGPAGVFKAIFVDHPDLVPKAAATIMVSPSLFAYKGGIQGMAGACVNPAACMGMRSWDYFMITINEGREKLGKKPITFDQLRSGDY
jgi:hypothetical protein